jgi:hypothetical protein
MRCSSWSQTGPSEGTVMLRRVDNVRATWAKSGMGIFPGTGPIVVSVGAKVYNVQEKVSQAEW